MSSLNRCDFIGNLGRDPELRQLQDGTQVANLSLAVTERWKKDGERKERTEWVRIVAFGKLADIASQYLHKGSKIYTSGKLQSRKWTDQSGQDRYSTEVVLSGLDGKLVMLDSKPRDDRPAEQSHPDNSTEPPDPQAPLDDLDDDIPFN